MTASVATMQEEGQPTRYFPGFAGKLRTEVPGFMDIVGYLYSENKTGVINRKLQVVGTRRVQAKDRTSTLGGSLENTTISEIWNHIISGTLNPSAVHSDDSETLPEESIEATAA
jgi:hypothetical protein